MPTLAEFAGLKVCMHREDRSPHHFPHIHAYFAEYDAVIRVPDGELIEMENWRLIGSDKKFFRISPLEVK